MPTAPSPGGSQAKTTSNSKFAPWPKSSNSIFFVAALYLQGTRKSVCEPRYNCTSSKATVLVSLALAVKLKAAAAPWLAWGAKLRLLCLLRGPPPPPAVGHIRNIRNRGSKGSRDNEGN